MSLLGSYELIGMVWDNVLVHSKDLSLILAFIRVLVSGCEAKGGGPAAIGPQRLLITLILKVTSPSLVCQH